MRKVTEQITDAFIKKQPRSVSNSNTDGSSLFLFGNKIAEWKEDGLYITDAGWPTNTTKERLNALPNVCVQKKKGQWYLNGELWNGGWKRIVLSLNHLIFL